VSFLPLLFGSPLPFPSSADSSALPCGFASLLEVAEDGKGNRAATYGTRQNHEKKMEGRWKVGKSEHENVGGTRRRTMALKDAGANCQHNDCWPLLARERRGAADARRRPWELAGNYDWELPGISGRRMNG